LKVKLLLVSLIVWTVASYADDTKVVPILVSADLSGWQEQLFLGRTAYQPVFTDGRQAIKASSHQSASGLIRKIDVDLTQTPWLNWSWRVDAPLQGNDETSKQGDDYAVRIYVVVDGGLWFWRTRAISYVWASAMPKGSHWPNAYTANAMMVAVESGTAGTGQWLSERRNVLMDLQGLHGIDTTDINAVAIMTDTDNSGQTAIAYYGDIYFSAD
jgi:hypothetical protein